MPKKTVSKKEDSRRELSYGLKDRLTDQEYRVNFNWSKEDKCFDYFTLDTGDKKVELSTSQLRMLLFSVSDDENKNKLMNFSQEEILTFEYLVKRKLERDYKEGDVVEFFMDFPIEVFRLEPLISAVIEKIGVESSKKVINKLYEEYDKNNSK